jgi:tRNA-splicing ligase RtcB
MVKKIIESERIPIKLWLDDLEPKTLQQAKNLANFPYSYHHVAIMPDAHVGYGMPIGGVVSTENVIIPHAVGVDIGCGVCAVKTSLNGINTKDLKRILGRIRKSIPTGFNKHKSPQNEALMPDNYTIEKLDTVSQNYQYARKSLGTLGGGNHFIEVQEDQDGYIWLMIHSGSRNLGKQVADFYDKMAVKFCKENGYHDVVRNQLAFLEVESEEGKAYIEEMRYAVDFALCNRKVMMQQVKNIVADILGDVSFEGLINIAHNYAAKEIHFSKEVWVHRKGATRAFVGETGIIPGCQGSPSYIVKGKGNIESFKSCSHGAGRIMGRREAERRLDLQKERSKLEEKGVLHALRGKSD